MLKIVKYLSIIQQFSTLTEGPHDVHQSQYQLVKWPDITMMTKFKCAGFHTQWFFTFTALPLNYHKYGNNLIQPTTNSTWTINHQAKDSLFYE